MLPATRSIPWLYRITLGLILVASILLVRPAAGPYRRMRGYADLFFMGAAALLYAALLAALIVAWAVPPSSLLSLSPLPRFFAAVLIAFAPIFFANMVFAQRFRDTGDTGTAFGANLLGAMLGGVLEYAALIVGCRWLLVFVALLYGLAFLTGWRHLRIAGPADARTPQTTSTA
ncbi:MAG: hypothetical protein ACRDOD_01890 [Streptosporangiaceae bacterium]